MKNKKLVHLGVDVEAIRIIFPVYYGEPPMMIKEFAEKLEDIKGKYVFAVCTYGGAASASLRILKGIIHSKGGKLSTAYGIQMPQSSFYKPRENREKVFSEWKISWVGLSIILKIELKEYFIAIGH